MGRGSSKAGGGSGGGKMSASDMYAKASKDYTVDYEPYKRGQISKTDAGQLYKAVKNGDVDAKPELTRQLYNETEEQIRFANERYTRDHIYYDDVEKLTHSLLNKDYKTAQALVNKIEDRQIELASKKSKWYKYKKR